MEYRVLGPVEVVDDDGNVLDLGPRKQRALLCFLLLHANQVVSTDRIVDALWGEDALDKERALWTVVSRLRSALEPQRDRQGESTILLTHDQGYSLAIDGDSLDLHRFRESVDGARDLARTDPAEAAAVLDVGLGLWRGDPLGEFRLEEFARTDVGRLEELRLEALELRAEVGLGQGRGREQIAELEQLYDQNPLNERFVDLFMRALYEGGRQAEALRVFTDYRRRIGEELGIDPSPELCRLEEQILLHDTAVQPAARDAAAGPEATLANPFKGLRAFREEDADDFHGRDGLVAEIVEAIAGDRTLVAVVGPSGSGKSSVVRAGVIPALRAGAIDGSENWVVAQMTPGALPFAELEAALARSAVDLTTGDDALLRAALRALPDESSTLLLVIDQFEELFTLTDEATRTRFIAVLLTALDDVRARVRVIVTLRADFYGRPLAYPELGARLSGNVVNVTMLSADELHAAAVEPATAAGVRFEPAALAALIADVGGEPGALPLFQYALTELFDRREGNLLTVEAYGAMGGVEGALGRRADELFAELDSNQQRAARELLLRLVTLGDGDTWTRRRAHAAEIISLDTDVVTLQAVIERFGRHRLLAFDKDPASGAPTLEVAHEALLTAWPTLSRWIDESRDDLERLDSLRRLVDEWLAADEQPDYLASGSRLDELEAWSQRSAVSLTDQERRYIAAATERRDKDRESEAARLRREARRLRAALGATAVGLVLALIAGGFAFVQQGLAEDRAAEADRQATAVTARVLAARAIALSDRDPLLALAIAAETQSIVDPPPLEASESLIVARQAFSSDTWSQLDPPFVSTVDEVEQIVVAPNDQTTLAVVGTGGFVDAAGENLEFYDVWSGELLGRIDDNAGQVVAFSPDGSTAYVGDASGGIAVIDRANGVRREWLSGALAHEAAVFALTVSPDGTLLASGDSAGTTKLWDIPAGTRRGEPYVTRDEAVLALAFSPDGARLAIGGGGKDLELFTSGARVASGGDGFLRLIDVDDGAPMDVPVGARPLDLEFSPDGSMLASATLDEEGRDIGGVVQLWNPNTGDPVSPTIEGNLEGARAVAFSPDGRVLLAAGYEEVRMWDTESGTMIDSLDLSEGLDVPFVWSRWAFAFSENQVVVAQATTSTVRRWRRSLDDSLGQSVAASVGAVHEVAYSPAGDLVATGGADGTVRLWDARTATEVRRPLVRPAGIASLVFSADGSSLVAGDFGGGVSVVDTGASGVGRSDPLLELPSPALAVALGPDGMVVAASGAQVVVVDAATGMTLRAPIDVPERLLGVTAEEERLLSALGNPVLTTEIITAVALSSDGLRLAASSVSGGVFVVDLDTSTDGMDLLVEHRGSALDVGLSRGGATLASAGSDGIVRLFDLATREPSRVSINIGTAVESVAFSPDGRLLATADRSGGVRFWSLESGLQLGRPVGHDAPVIASDFSPSGTHVASGSRDGTLQILDILDPAAACNRVTPLVSPERLAAELGLGRDPDFCDYG